MNDVDRHTQAMLSQVLANQKVMDDKLNLIVDGMSNLANRVIVAERELLDLRIALGDGDDTTH